MCRRPGVTVIEVLVTVAIIGALFALLLPAVQRVRAAAAGAACQHNLRQLALASHGYHDAVGCLPPALRKPSPGDRYYHLSWLARILPYMDQAALWGTIEQDFARNARPFAPPRHQAIGHPMRQLFCPADPHPPTDSISRVQPDETRIGFTTYLGNLGANSSVKDGVIVPNARIRLTDVTDGTSSTLLAGERPYTPDLRFGWWYSGRGQDGTGSLDFVLGVREVNLVNPRLGAYRRCGAGPFAYDRGRDGDICSAFHHWSFHNGGCYFALSDGSVKLIRYTAGALLPALASRAGGEVVTIPD